MTADRQHVNGTRAKGKHLKKKWLLIRLLIRLVMAGYGCLWSLKILTAANFRAKHRVAIRHDSELASIENKAIELENTDNQNSKVLS